MIHFKAGRLALYLIFTTISLTGKSQFFEHIYPTGTINHYTAVEKIPSSTKIIIGENDGSMHLSIDSGATISSIASPTSGRINSIKFKDNLNGFLATTLGELYTTVDGGNSWNISYNNPSLSFNKLALHVSGKIIGICDNGYYVLSDTNGANWTLSQFLNNFNLNDLVSLSNSVNIIIGDSGLIATSNDLITWNETIYDSTKNLYSISFPDTVTGYISGGEQSNGSNIIIKTTDGGTLWNTHLGNLHSGLNNNYDKLKSIFFTTPNRGFMLGSHFLTHLYETNDGGATWTENYFHNKELDDIYFYNGQSGFMFGNNDHLLRTNNTGEGWLYVDKSLPNGRIEDASFVSDSVGYCVGDYGLIIKTVDYGSNWTFLQDSFINTQAKSVLFLNNQIGFIGYANGDIYKTTDGGSSFHEVYENPYSDPYSKVNSIFTINFFNDSIGVALGWNSIVLRTNDQGNTWIESPLQPSFSYPNDYIFEKVHYFNSTNIIAIANKRQVNAGQLPVAVFESLDGGISWDTIAKLPNTVRDLTFTSDSIGYIGAANGKMFKSNNHGDNWSELLSLSQGGNTCNGCIRSNYFFDDNEGYTLDYDGLLKTLDGGQTWSPIPYYGGTFTGGDIYFPEDNHNIGYILGGTFGLRTGDVGNVIITGPEDVCSGNEINLSAANGDSIVWANLLSPTVIIDSATSITVSPTVTTSYIVYSNNGSDTLTVIVNDGTDVVPVCQDVNFNAGGYMFFSPDTITLEDFNYIFPSFSFLGYLDLTCDHKITVNNLNQLSLNITNSGASNRSYKVWLDINNDGIFDVSELLMNDSLSTNTLDSALIPGTTITNKFLRCRIGISDNTNSIQACPTSTAFGTGYLDFSLKINCNVTSQFTTIDNSNGNYSFTNNSTGNITQSHWAFGDGTTSNSTNPNHSFTVNGTFVVVLTINDSLSAGSCTDFFFDTVTVTGVAVPLQCSSGFVIYPDTLTGDITVVNSATGSNLTYLWDYGDGNTSTLQTPNYTYATSGPFYLCLTIDDGAGCSNMYCDSIGENGVVFKQSGFTINVIPSAPIATGIDNNIDLNSEIKVYPNPASSKLSIVSDYLTIEEITIIDVTGKIIMTIKQNTNNINVADLSDGIYFIKLVTDEKTITKKFVKQ
tara:strand:- start:4263 stop:7664 length:3402 start_codon:yes stop_codon:yes gene_type:complete